MVGLLAAALLTVGLGACSDDDGYAATTTTTTASPIDGSTSTTDDAGPKPPEYYSPVDHSDDGGTDGDVLLDGRHFGWITTLIAGHDEIVGELDLAEVYFGDEAAEAVEEDGPDALESGADFYIRNLNPKVRAIQVDPEARVYDVEYGSDGCCEPVAKSPAQFVADRDANAEERTPVNLTIADGTVTEISEVYFP